MTRSRIRVDDVVKVDRGGGTFYAVVTGKPPATKPGDPIEIRPIVKAIGYRTCTPAQVVDVYRRLPPLKPRKRP